MPKQTGWISLFLRAASGKRPMRRSILRSAFGGIKKIGERVVRRFVFSKRLWFYLYSYRFPHPENGAPLPGVTDGITGDNDCGVALSSGVERLGCGGGLGLGLSCGVGLGVR